MAVVVATKVAVVVVAKVDMVVVVSLRVMRVEALSWFALALVVVVMWVGLCWAVAMAVGLS